MQSYRKKYQAMLTIGGARSLPSNVKVLTFGQSYGTTKDINIAAKVLALPSKSFVLLGKKAAPLPYHKVCYPASNNMQLVSQAVRQPEVFHSARALFSL